MSNDDETVTVPVGLLKRLSMIARDTGADDEAVEANALISKLKPKLVMVDLDELKALVRGSTTELFKYVERLEKEA